MFKKCVMQNLNLVYRSHVLGLGSYSRVFDPGFQFLSSGSRILSHCSLVFSSEFWIRDPVSWIKAPKSLFLVHLIFDKNLLQSVAVITRCDRYYKVPQLLQSETQHILSGKCKKLIQNPYDLRQTCIYPLMQAAIIL